MSTEREMLEAAARAAGYRFAWVGPDRDTPETLEKGTWNPRAFDGDALRLAAALRISVEHNLPGDKHPWVCASFDPADCSQVCDFMEDVPDESQRADRMRLAILRCAAAQPPANGCERTESDANGCSEVQA